MNACLHSKHEQTFHTHSKEQAVAAYGRLHVCVFPASSAMLLTVLHMYVFCVYAVRCLVADADGAAIIT
jgi:hypothetical protein